MEPGSWNWKTCFLRQVGGRGPEFAHQFRLNDFAVGFDTDRGWRHSLQLPRLFGKYPTQNHADLVDLLMEDGGGPAAVPLADPQFQCGSHVLCKSMKSAHH